MIDRGGAIFLLGTRKKDLILLKNPKNASTRLILRQAQ